MISEFIKNNKLKGFVDVDGSFKNGRESISLKAYKSIKIMTFHVLYNNETYVVKHIKDNSGDRIITFLPVLFKANILNYKIKHPTGLLGAVLNLCGVTLIREKQNFEVHVTNVYQLGTLEEKIKNIISNNFILNYNLIMNIASTYKIEILTSRNKITVFDFIFLEKRGNFIILKNSIKFVWQGLSFNFKTKNELIRKFKYKSLRFVYDGDFSVNYEIIKLYKLELQPIYIVRIDGAIHFSIGMKYIETGVLANESFAINLKSFITNMQKRLLKINSLSEISKEEYALVTRKTAIRILENSVFLGEVLYMPVVCVNDFIKTADVFVIPKKESKKLYDFPLLNKIWEKKVFQAKLNLGNFPIKSQDCDFIIVDSDLASTIKKITNYKEHTVFVDRPVYNWNVAYYFKQGGIV